nr:hypothetical protein RP007_03282 [Rhizobium sp. P007]
MTGVLQFLKIPKSSVKIPISRYNVHCRQRIIGLCDRDTDRRGAEGAPQLGVQRALDDADLLAFQLLGACYRFLSQQMARAVIDEIGSDELLGGKLRL